VYYFCGRVYGFQVGDSTNARARIFSVSVEARANEEEFNF
jgi:hypothetical protein